MKQFIVRFHTFPSIATVRIEADDRDQARKIILERGVRKESIIQIKEDKSLTVNLYGRSDLYVKAEPLPSGFWAVWCKDCPWEEPRLDGAAYTQEDAEQAVRDLVEYYENRHSRPDPGYPGSEPEDPFLHDDYALC